MTFQYSKPARSDKVRQLKETEDAINAVGGGDDIQTDDNGNVAFGDGAGLLGNSNIAFGASALAAETSDANSDMAFGIFAFVNLTSGARNTGFGFSVGGTLDTGDDNVLIGNTADVASGEITDAVAIGSGAVAAASHTAQIGSTTVLAGRIGGSTTVSALPSAATVGAGARAFVTDATATTFMSTVAGNGSNKVPVVSDGTNWKIG